MCIRDRVDKDPAASLDQAAKAELQWQHNYEENITILSYHCVISVSNSLTIRENGKRVAGASGPPGIEKVKLSLKTA